MLGEPNDKLILAEAKASMDKAVTYFKDQLTSIRIGAIGPGVIESFRVNNVRIGHMSQVSRIPNGISVTPFDPTSVGQIVKALEGGGYNAYVASKTTAHVILPKMLDSGEIEKVKNHVRKLGEEAKIVVRSLRKDVRQGKTKEELKLLDKDLQKITDQAISVIDGLVQSKVSP
jgi:ribosome recycling factor